MRTHPSAPPTRSRLLSHRLMKASSVTGACSVGVPLASRGPPVAAKQLVTACFFQSHTRTCSPKERCSFSGSSRNTSTASGKNARAMNSAELRFACVSFSLRRRSAGKARGSRLRPVTVKPQGYHGKEMRVVPCHGCHQQRVEAARRDAEGRSVGWPRYLGYPSAQ